MSEGTISTQGSGSDRKDGSLDVVDELRLLCSSPTPERGESPPKDPYYSYYADKSIQNVSSFYFNS